MSEYEAITSDDSLSQGDVLEWVGANYSPPWKTFGVVVTTDCDLEWGKHGGYVSYVPALLSLDFIWQYWRPDRFNRELDRALGVFSIRLENWIKKHKEYQMLPSNQAIMSLVRRRSLPQFLDDMEIEESSHRNSFTNILEPIYCATEILDSNNPDIDVLLKCYAKINSKFHSESNLLMKEIEKSWASLPGDIFHLPCRPNDSSDGLFLLLRHIRQIDAGDVALRPDQVRFEGAPTKRVGRIAAPYRYAITQSLAKVFSDIGLPADHEARKKNAADVFYKTRIAK